MVIDGIDYGPIGHLVGSWEGEGLDVAPNPVDTTEENEFYDKLFFEAIGTVTNANMQTLSAIYYRHRVYSKKSGNGFHDQTGYFLYDPANKMVVHTFNIPRGVNILAIGKAKGSEPIELELSTNEQGGGILQTPFMANKAKTTSYTMQLSIYKDKLSYKQTTMLEIYNNNFTHIDESILKRVD